MNVLLISTYELGRQPFGLASPAAQLRQAGFRVTCLDLSLQQLDGGAVAAADLIAFYLPMHTATRIASSIVDRVKALNPPAHLCFYGLYAPVNEAYLRGLGGQTILGGEFEDGLMSLAQRLSAEAPESGSAAQIEPVISLARQQFLVPDRKGLPSLKRYAHVLLPSGEKRTVGYTEATRGCKHLCRHCPIVPVYGGVFRTVPRDVVLADVDQQVAAGARHVTFGDPDFFNGPAHGLRIVEKLHRRHPAVTFDVTIKIEHLLQHANRLPALRDSGCLFVTSAVESFDDEILAAFDKRHTREDVARVVSLFNEVGLILNPTFVTFTPWTTLDGFIAHLHTIAELDLVENVAPIQYAIRLLIPSGSRLLELPDVQRFIGPFDARALAYPWANPDPRVDALYESVRSIAGEAPADADRREIFNHMWQQAERAAERLPTAPLTINALDTRHRSAAEPRRGHVPYLSEPWYCCAEPTEEQITPV